ncbi:DUF3857 domain-containing protein [Sphingomonas aracearum]|uniref:DUF3857 domain-containing protein n=1 Tax=Sphingomonas aracearum TaxID=2283317 RepID=A0A369VX83_9SPHN|nr:DUF3857 domain-containing protein [Sphingomonas aracearum]RDE06938.1 DUF3857 domain-containing protein [Sphingomonas aracearum]
MKRLALVTGLLLASTAVASGAQASDKPLYQPAPAWVKAGPPIEVAKLPKDAPVLLVMDNQQKLEDGQVWTYMETATLASSAQVLGAIGTIQLPWQPAQGDLIVHKAEILRGAEHIDLLKGGAPFQVLRREERMEQRMLDGMLTATMPVQGLAVGDVLHLAVSITRADPTLKGDLQTYAPLMFQPVRSQFARVRLLWPAKSDIRWKAYADKLDAKPVDLPGGYRELAITLPLDKQPEIPGDAPTRFQKLPILEATSFANWAAVSKVMAPLYATEGLIAPGSPLAAEVARIKAASADPMTRTAQALALVQDKVRYLLMGMDTGNYVPQRPADTWTLRYGDCKAKALLLLALLRALDVEAEPVLVSAQLGDLVPERLPGAGAFNHVIVRATVNGESLWLDGTAGGTRLADLRDTPPFANALPVRPAGAELIKIARHANARPDTVLDLQLDDSAGIGMPTLFHADVTVRGQLAEMMNAAGAQASDKDKRDMVTRMLSETIGEAQIGDWALAYDPAASIMKVTAAGVITTRWKKEGQRYRQSLDTAVTQIDFSPDRARPAWQAIPVATGGVNSAVYRTTLKLPAGGAGYALEGDTKLPATLGGVQVARRAGLANGVVTVEDRLDFVGAEIAPADLVAARTAFAGAKARQLRVIAPADAPSRVAVALAAAKSGALKPIEAMFAKAIAANPEEASGYRSRYSFRVGTLDRKGAIEDLTRLIALEPQAGDYLARASLYEAQGQKDRQRADIEAALKLDPASVWAIGSMASFKADGGDVAGALALLDEQIANGGENKTGYLSQKATLQAEHGQKEAALATLEAALAEKPGDPVLLNDRCWIKGTQNVALDTALKDCTKAIELADNPAAILDSRAMVYFRLGRMDDALADLDAALAAEPTMGASLYLRGVVQRRMGKAAAGDADLLLARAINPLSDERYGKFGIRP